jgi:hypothetical protein
MEIFWPARQPIGCCEHGKHFATVWYLEAKLFPAAFVGLLSREEPELDYQTSNPKTEEGDLLHDKTRIAAADAVHPHATARTGRESRRFPIWS